MYTLSKDGQKIRELNTMQTEQNAESFFQNDEVIPLWLIILIVLLVIFFIVCCFYVKKKTNTEI